MQREISIIIILAFLHIIVVGQTKGSIEKLKVQKESETDSAYFDFKDFALYSKTSGFSNRFKTIKKCKVEYTSRKKSGEFELKNNYLPKTFKKTIEKLRVKKIELRFSNIILVADSSNTTERKCPPFSYTVHKKRSFTWAVGAWAIPWPIPSYYIVDKK